MNISIRILIDDHSKDINNVTCNCVSVNSNLTVYDFQNLYKQSDDTEAYVIRCGEILPPNSRLSDLSISEGSFLKLIIKKRVIEFKKTSNEDFIKEIIKKHRQMMKTRFKQVINESLERGLDSVMDPEFGLERDLLAYSIASDYRILRTLLSSTENVLRLLQRCPVLIPAALKMINIIQEKLKKVSAQHLLAPNQDPRYFSLGEVEQSDDSSENDDDEDPSSSQLQPAPPISRSQLREAISSVAPPPERSGGHQPRAVSLSQLRSAIQTAIVAHEPMEVDGPPETATSGASGSSDTDQKVDQLSAMGFTNRDASKAALEASGGDIAAAIEFLLS